ncbi:MAG: hypothetical protein WD226_09715 [Planctomycetota bacterium]
MLHLDIATLQLPLDQAETLWASPRFFAAIFAGLVIALGLQLLLTTLSLATGVSAARGIDEPTTKTGGTADRRGSAKARKSGPETGNGKESRAHSIGAKMRNANRAYGMWAVITGSLSLFFGAWLGTELSLTVDAMAGATIGLVIWGLFYLTTFFVEMSLVGSLLRTVRNGLRHTAGGLGSILSGSDRRSTAKDARAVVDAVRDELLDDRRWNKLGKEIRGVVARMEERSDPAALREEIEKVLSRTEIEATLGDDGNGSGDGHRSFVASLKTRSGPSHKTRERASSAATAIREEANSEDPPVESAVTAGLRAAGLTRGDAIRYRERFEEYLRRTHTDELEPEGIKRDLEQLFDDPSKGWAALRERFAAADRDTVRALLTARGIEDERAERITSWAENALRSFAGSTKEMDSEMDSEMEGEPPLQSTGEYARTSPEFGENVAPQPRGSSAPKSTKMRSRIDSRIRDYLREVDDPHLRYEELRAEIELLLDDPRSGRAALVERLRALDRDSIVALLAGLPRIDERRADQIVRTIEDARDEVIERSERARAEIDRRLTEAKHKGLEAAEETRKTVATAAWWAFGAALTSGVAAALGGLVAVWTGIGT